MGGFTINRQKVTEDNVSLFLQILANSKIGNNGDRDFTTQELRNFFTHQAGIPSTSSLSEHAKVGFICVEDAYSYIKKNYPDILENIDYDVDNSLSPHVPNSVFVTQTLVGKDGESFYLVTPFHPDSLSYLVNEENIVVGTYKDGFSSLDRPEDQEQFWRLVDIEKIELPLPVLAEIPMEASVVVHNSHGATAQTHAALSFWANTPCPLFNVTFNINGERVEYSGRSLTPTDGPIATIAESYVIVSLPLHSFQTKGHFEPGMQAVNLQGEDVFGRIVSITSQIYVGTWKAGETEIVTFNTHPTTAEESELAQHLSTSVEEFNIGHEIPLRRVYFYRDLGHASVPNPDRMIVHLSYEENDGTSPSFDTLFRHEVEGHMGWPSLSVMDAQRLDEIYRELVFLNKSGEREMKIDYGNGNSPIPILLSPFFNSSPSPVIKSITGMSFGQNTAYPYKKSGIAYLKESLYLFDTPNWELTSQGHPWTSSYEMHASVYCIIRSGKKEELLAELNRNLSGRVLELTLEVVEIVSRDVQKVEDRLAVASE